MTTVAFVTYRFVSLDRRVGPVPLEEAKTMAKELSRKAMVANVAIEEWALLRTTKVDTLLGPA